MSDWITRRRGSLGLAALLGMLGCQGDSVTQTAATTTVQIVARWDAPDRAAETMLPYQLEQQANVIVLARTTDVTQRGGRHVLALRLEESSLLECGGGLDRSALLEYREGKGVVRLCQLNLEPVIGASPVADVLFERLIRLTPPDLPTRNVWYAGDETAKGYLTGRLGLTLTDLTEAKDHDWSANDLIVWMPHKTAIANDPSKAAARAVKAGASLLAFCPESKLLPALPDPPTYGQNESFRGRPFVIGPDGAILLALLNRKSHVATGLSNMELYAKRSQSLAHFEVKPADGWTSITRPGVIAWRQQGASDQVVVTAIRGAEGKIVRGYESLLHGLLTNLGAVTSDPQGSARHTGKFFTVDIRPYCTMAFRDEVDNDGKGGWTDQGPHNDLRNLPLGRQEFAEVPFDIIDPAANGEKSCIVLGGGTRLKDRPRAVNKIDFGHRKASIVYFLHSAAWATGQPGEYRIHYTKALDMHETIKLKVGQNISDWWSPNDTPEAIVGWESMNGLSPIGLYVYAWKNPHPDTAIDEIDFVSTTNTSILCLVAITGQE